MNFTVVTKKNLAQVKAELAEREVLCFDTETTGLQAYHQSQMFSLAIADMAGNAWYFNFKSYRDLGDEYVLKFSDVAPIMQTSRRWVAHNAKFDLHFTDKAGIKPIGQVTDTEVLARLFENQHQFTRGGYSLSTCAERWLNTRKDDRVMTWMEENGAFTSIPNAEGQSSKKHYYFDMVPFDIISEYAAKDAHVTAELYLFLTGEMYETSHLPEMESRLTSVLFEMERDGVFVDREYLVQAYDHEKWRAGKAEAAIAELGISDFTDSAKFLSPILKERGFEIPQTEKGNDQVTDDVLRQKPDDPLAHAVAELRDATKRATTYFSNYLFLADESDVIHPNFRQSGTVTGRMACNSPNLQNIPAEDSGDFPIRRAFKARPGFFFCAIDYRAVEFRIALHYAGERELIEKIAQGHDPHQAAADLTGLSRKSAKTFNFAVLFGAGLAKIGEMLGCPVDQARREKYAYFDKLPRLRNFIYEAKARMEQRGYAFNAYGRRYRLDDPRFSYKAVNSIVQGTAADVMKRAMINCHTFLKALKSRLVLSIHDELIFEVHDSEHQIVEHLKSIMEKAHGIEGLNLECSVEVGPNLNDMEPA